MIKPWYKRWRTWIYVFAALAIFGLVMPDQSEESVGNKGQAAETAKEPETKSEKPEESSETKAVNTTAVTEKKTEKPADPPKPKTLQDVVTDVMGKDAYVDMYTEDGTVWLTVKLLDNWSAGWMLKGAYMDTLDISEQVVKHNLLNGAKELDIAFVTSFTDSYGNSSDGTAVEITFSVDTLSKINFDTVLHENVPVIADYYFEHPAFQAE